jgi:hypothetical protein
MKLKDEKNKKQKKNKELFFFPSYKTCFLPLDPSYFQSS